MISMSGLSQVLPQGVHEITISFQGWEIRNSETNGPYTLNLVSRGDPEAEHQELLSVYDTYEYDFEDFELLSAEFTGTFNDNGVDTDDDSLFNLLQINTEIIVNKQGFYSVSGELYKDDIFIV